MYSWNHHQWHNMTAIQHALSIYTLASSDKFRFNSEGWCQIAFSDVHCELAISILVAQVWWSQMLHQTEATQHIRRPHNGNIHCFAFLYMREQRKNTILHVGCKGHEEVQHLDITLLTSMTNTDISNDKTGTKWVKLTGTFWVSITLHCNHSNCGKEKEVKLIEDTLFALYFWLPHVYPH